MRAKTVALASTLAGAAVALRYAKNALTTVQFINIPLAMAYLAAWLAGPWAGAAVAALSYLVSDLLVMPGPWTPVDAALGAAAALVFGLAAGRLRGRVELGVLAYLATFLYDVLSSSLLYMVFGLGPGAAFAVGLAGLFLPVMGGGLVGVGPMTEAATALLAVGLIEAFERRGVALWRRRL